VLKISLARETSSEIELYTFLQTKGPRYGQNQSTPVNEGDSGRVSLDLAGQYSLRLRRYLLPIVTRLDIALALVL
jgi:hypothetical protein